MKNIIFILVLITSIFAACSVFKNHSSNASMNCSIDGRPWNSVTRVSLKKAGGFSINGSAMQQDALDITITGQNAGKYVLGTMQFGFTASYSAMVSNPDSLYTAINGTVDVSEIDTQNSRISGTFTFDMINVKNNSRTKTFRNGVFTNLTYN